MIKKLTARLQVNGYRILLVLAAVIALQGCSSGSSPSSEVAIETTKPVIKSANDERQYRHIILDNKLDVLLISDPSTDKAAASLDVYVGSYQNPADREGLAHFLEHMLFSFAILLFVALKKLHLF